MAIQTTSEQFRIVLRWVKEYPILARSDSEVPKEERELKKQLWEKLAIELNEIGPPIKTWTGWKKKLNDYKYNLKNKIRRRITQGSAMLPLSDLENEALQVALLEVNFNFNCDSENISFPDTPPEEDIPMPQVSPENSSTLQDDPSGGEDIDRFSRMFGIAPQNDNVDMTEVATNNDAIGLTKYVANGSPNVTATITSGSLKAISQVHESPAQCHLSKSPTSCQLSENPEDLSKLSTISTITLNANPDMPETCKPNDPTGSIEFPLKIEPELQSMPIIPNTAEVSPTQNYFNPTSSQINEYSDLSHVPLVPFPEAVRPKPPTLTKEEMNILFGGMSDKSKSEAAKSRKRRGAPRKRTEKTMKTTPENEEKKQEIKPKRNTQENRTSRPKKIASSQSKSKILKEGENKKKLMSSRIFRHSLLTLLAEANEMEKRRIAVTETKVRNQTEIQSLEITRMNLEIMKLQKEIILLEHGGKIFS